MLGWHVCEGAKPHDWHGQEVPPLADDGLVATEGSSFVE